MFDMFNKLVKDAQKLAGTLKTEIKGKGDEIAITCPSCGAKVKGNEFDNTFVCQYCGDIIQNNFADKKKQMIKGKINVGCYKENNYQSDTKTQKISENSNKIYIDEVYAVISHEGLFYNGEVPGLTFSDARMCHSYDECVKQLTEKVNKKRNFMSFKAPKFSKEELELKYPNSKIIKL